MGKFDIGEFAKTLRQTDVSNSDTGREQIEYIDIDLLDADEKNFYGLSDLEELASNIEFVGLQQPLRVRPNPNRPGRFFIVSGHRRLAALKILVDAGRTELREVPCIREQPVGSAALQELRLIYANSDTRKLSSADLSKQAERVETLLYQLKEEGIEFPGRMRDHVAEACKVSKTKLARLKVIRENLIPEFAKHYEKGDLKESAAYTLAQHTAEIQKLVWKYLNPMGKEDMSHLTEWRVSNEIGRIKPVSERICRNQAGGPPCSHRDALLDKLFDGTRSYKPCDQVCCDKCDKLRSCKSACPLLAEKAKKLRADNAAQNKQEKLAQQERDQPTIDAISEYWRRLATARAAAGKSVKGLFKATETYYSEENEEQWLKKEALQKINRDDALPFGMYSISLRDAEKIRATADLLGVTTDYLLCRTDDPKGGAAGAKGPAEDWAPMEWLSGKEQPQPGQTAVIKILAESMQKPTKLVSRWYNGCWRSPDGSAVGGECVGWLPLPKDEAGGAMRTPHAGDPCHLSRETDSTNPELRPQDSETKAAPTELVHWEARSRTPPIGALILTYDLTNDGPVLRPAVWDGTSFHAPGKPSKKLTGLQFTKWLHIPMACSGETYRFDQGGTASSVVMSAESSLLFQWRSPQVHPEDGVLAVAKFRVPGMSKPLRNLVQWNSGRWCFPNGATIDAECVGWYPLPADKEAEA